MSNLKKISDEDRESKFGYVYAVSGPGKWMHPLPDGWKTSALL